MIVKVILEKSKVVKGIIEDQRGQNSSLLFIIHHFSSFLFLRKDLYF